MSLLNGPPIKRMINTPPPRQVWVLGASLGGPKALAEFLSHLHPPLSATLIIAQHLDNSSLPLLIQQLQRHTTLPVIAANHGDTLHSGTVVMTPADKHFTISHEQTIQLKPYQQPPPYHPYIDLVMQAVSLRYSKQSGAIIFSGMGDDGSLGCHCLHQNGGTVWAQSSASCIISSMPDSARRTKTVSYSGNPRQLARHLEHHILKQTDNGQTDVGRPLHADMINQQSIG